MGVTMPYDLERSKGLFF